MGQGNSSTRAQTSIDILHERNALRERVSELEDAMKIVLGETEVGARNPELNFLTMCRVACVARRALGRRGPDIVSVREIRAHEEHAVNQ